MDAADLPEYVEGEAWADQNLDRLRERFTGKDLQTQELRDILWPEAERRYPSMRDSMENDFRATAWVSGAIRRLTETMNMDREGMIAVFEVALEMGAIFGAEAAKHDALEEIKAKPKKWWHQKFGQLTPNDLIKPIFQKWWREVGEPEKRRQTSRAEALKYVMGAREMRVFATIQDAVRKGEPGDYYVLYDVSGEDSSYEMVAEESRTGRSNIGDIVG